MRVSLCLRINSTEVKFNFAFEEKIVFGGMDLCVLLSTHVKINILFDGNM